MVPNKLNVVNAIPGSVIVEKGVGRIERLAIFPNQMHVLNIADPTAH